VTLVATYGVTGYGLGVEEGIFLFATSNSSTGVEPLSFCLVYVKCFVSHRLDIV